MSARLPIVFTQHQIDEMSNKSFDVYDYKIRARMDEFQSTIDGIQSRTDAREAAIKKWNLKSND